MSTGEYEALSDMGSWSEATAAVVHGDRIYAVSGGSLYWLDPAAQKYGTVGDESWSSRLLLSAGERLLSFEENGTLYAIDPRSGEYESFEGSWDVSAGAMVGGRAYVVDNSVLYRIHPGSGAYEEVGEESWSSLFLAAVGDALYSVESDGSIYAIDPEEGSYEELAESWDATTAFVGYRDRLYAVAASALYAVDPSDGAEEPLNEETWSSRFLLPLGDRLVTIEEDGSVYAIQL